MLDIDDMQVRVESIAKNHNIKAVYLFGSYARGDNDVNSDIDLFVDYGANHPLTVYPLIALSRELREALNVRVDVVTARALQENPGDTKFETRLENEKVLLYESS